MKKSTTSRINEIMNINIFPDMKQQQIYQIL